MFRVYLIRSDHQLYSYSTEDTVQIVNSFIAIPITHIYNYSHLFLTLLCVYTIIILYVRNYNHLFHSYTFTLADFSAINYLHKLSQTEN
jgi:hypothetical protein